MTISATLKRLVISSPQVDRVAQLYVNTFGYRAEMRGGEAHCEGEHRSLWVRPGRANQLLHGNLAEISSDLETCEPDRPVGSWNHCVETLNQWGVAIMRS